MPGLSVRTLGSRCRTWGRVSGHRPQVVQQGCPEIDADELDFVLDLAAAALDVEKHEAETPGEKKIRWAFLESEGFRRARNALGGSVS